ncbi:30S ribosomal protein S31 [Quillaja saponaria]|uniref:30S ribosomal protein S31 n=1 Tax=Quillaja saponaria TaxID=32244 RepID=A0AAD7M034_QUISA|nr:30S ribosomal protein S31 [Quillaja saponaria]
MTTSMMQWCGAVARRVLMSERPSLTAASTSTGAVPILCGRGDKRTKKGKRFKGSYGNARPEKEKKIERIKDKVEVPSPLLGLFLSSLPDFIHTQYPLLSL